MEVSPNLFQRLWSETKIIAATYTAVFVVVMILNQLLFFGFCLNPICLVAAMPHVLVITVVVGTWIYKPSRKKIEKTLLFVRENYDVVKENIEKNKKIGSNKLFTGNVHLIVTQNQSKGEDDFKAVLARHRRPKIVRIIRMNNSEKEKSLLAALEEWSDTFKAGDIVAIVRGGGDLSDPQFNAYRFKGACDKLKFLSDECGVISVSGIGHSTDQFLIEKSVNFAQITPTDAANQVAYLINGGKW